MTGEVLRWITSLGVASIVLAIVNGLFGKRKLSAEATKIITDAASGTVKDLREENVQLRARLASTETRQDAQEIEQAHLRDENRSLADLVLVHGVWDQQAFTMLREQGIELPPPPPLQIGG